MSRSQALYDLIISKAKPKWFSGEIVYLWKDDPLAVYLQPNDPDYATVELFIRGWHQSMRVFFADTAWELSRHFTPVALEDFLAQYNLMAQRFRQHRISADGMSQLEPAPASTELLDVNKIMRPGQRFKRSGGAIIFNDAHGNTIKI